MTARMLGRAAVTTAALLGLSGVVSPPGALAGLTARRPSSHLAGSGTFAVTPVTPGTSTASGPLTFGLVPQPAYLDVLNTGSLSLTGTTYGVTYVGLGTLTLTACPGGSWSGGTCTTTPVQIGTWTQGSTATITVGASNLPTAYPAAVGGRLPLKATLSLSLLSAVATAVVTTTVSSGPTRQVRSATTTSS